MKLNKSLIIILSIVIPALVGVLFLTSFKLPLGSFVKYIPAFNAIINSLTAISLILAVIVIKKGNERVHKLLVLFSFVLGALFLLSYVVYHSSVITTIYGDIDKDGVLSIIEREELGSMRLVYLFILFSHILLSIIVIPFVLFAVYYGLENNRLKHRKVVKYTFPIWLYVSVTGVIIYLMISPYY